MMGSRRRLLVLAVLLSAWAGWACGPAGIKATPSKRPANVPDTDVSWYSKTEASNVRVRIGVIRAPGTGSHPAVLLVPGTEGLNVDYLAFAREMSVEGFDSVVGCWFDAGTPTDANDPRIACAGAPAFDGVTDRAVTDLDALVVLTREVLGPDARIGLIGFSRGGGLVMLRASHGAPEPVASVAGMLEGTTAWGNLPGEVNVVKRAADITAPVLILHGTTDGMVKVGQARAMEAALRADGADVVAKYYDGLGHGLAQDPATRRDLIASIGAFMCARLECAPPPAQLTPG